jgi:hypothetical protein
VSSSDPQPPAAPAGSQQPSTQEIPVAQPAAGATATQQLPPHPGATTPAPVQPVDTVVPTGPVDFVPGLPGLGTPPPPPPVRPAPVPVPQDAPPADTGSRAARPTTLESPAVTDPPKRSRAAWARPALLGLGLTVVSLALLEVGLLMQGGELESYWQRIPLWSAFATGCALLAVAVFAAVLAGGNRVRSGPAWRVAAAGLVGLAAFWLLVVLPVVDSDRGFVLTAALAALGGALWIGPRREG